MQAVESVRLARPLVDAPVNLLHERGQPESIDPEGIEVPFFQLLEDAGQVPALEVP